MVFHEVVHHVDLLLEVLKRKVGPFELAANEAVTEDDANHRLVGELLRVVRQRTLAVVFVGKLLQDDHGIVHACAHHQQLSRVFRGDVGNYTTQQEDQGPDREQARGPAMTPASWNLQLETPTAHHMYNLIL